MKAGLLTIAALAVSATAQVQRRAVGHNHQHQHQHAHKRDDVVYQYETVTADAPVTVVYVDSNGNKVDPPASPAPAAPVYQAPPPVYKAPPPVYKAPPPVYKAPPPPAYAPPKVFPSKSSAASSATPSAFSSGGISGYGITYTPYTSDGGCKSADQVNADFEKLDGYSLYRIYGCDCSQITNVIAAVKAKKARIMLGVFNIAQVETEVQSIISSVNGDWSVVDTISIGNELANQGTAVSVIVSAINIARGLLRSAGFTGDVVTVDTFNAIIANPELCQASDHAAANCHAFFDSTGTADQAGAFVAKQAALVKEACGGKRVVITESGWPYAGDSNNMAVPSVENQAIALASIREKFKNDIILFSSFSDGWKKNNPATFNCEQYWGIYDHPQ